MSEQVISLSSDEEDTAEPPPKRYKPPVLPEVTLTLVTSPKLPNHVSIETVLLDSDDETTEKISKKLDVIKKTNNLEIVKKTVEITSSTNKVDLIDLIDDEDIQSEVTKTDEVDKTSSNAKVNVTCISDETVSVDDSDNEVVPSTEESNNVTYNSREDSDKKSEENKPVEENNQSILIDDSDDETEKENHCENESSEAFPVQCKKTSATDILAASSSKDQFIETNQNCDLPNVKCKELFVDVYRLSATEDKIEFSNKIGVSNSSKNNNLFTTNHNESWAAARASSATKDELEEAKNLFKKFIKMVEEKIVDSAFEEILPKKVPIIRKYFNRSGTYINDKMFKTLLAESISGIKKSTTASGANTAVLAFHKVFEHLKSHVTESTIVVEEDHLPKIKKLERTIKLLRKRIHQLEVAEVNFDDDEDSAYIMLDRYQSRLNKVYAKYCQYIKRNPYHGRATHDRITFVNSSYNVLNQAITKKFKNSLVFPSYYELEKYITKVAKRENLNLSEGEVRIESKKCFKVLGNIFQKKRRQELYDSHLDFVEFSEDPATKDISLENVLKKNYSEGKEKIEKLYQKYVNKQEKGEDTVSTEDEQSSEDSDAEENNKGKKSKAKKGDKVKGKKGNVKNNKVQGKCKIKDDKVSSEDIPGKVNGEKIISEDSDAEDDKGKKDKAKKGEKLKGKKGNLKNNKEQGISETKDADIASEDIPEKANGKRRTSLKDEDQNEIIEQKQDEDEMMEAIGEDKDDNTEIEKEKTLQNFSEENQANDIENHIGSKEENAL